MQPPRSPPSPPNGYGYTGAMFSAPPLWVGGGVSSSSSSSSIRNAANSLQIEGKGGATWRPIPFGGGDFAAGRRDHIYIYINKYIYIYIHIHVHVHAYINACIHACILQTLSHATSRYVTWHHITSHHITSHHITSHSIHTLMHAHNKRYSNAFWICFWSLSLLQGNICITSQRMLECNYAPDSPRKYLDDALTTLNQYGHAPLLPFLCKTTKT